MKKQLLLILAVILPVIASADDSGTCGPNLTWTYVEATHTLTISGEGDMAVFDFYYGISTNPWYSYRNDITKAIIEDGVTSIGDFAFRDCRALNSITIPNSLTSIGRSAFLNCSNLNSILIPNSVTSIGSYAFEGTAWYNNQPDGLVYAGKVAYRYKGTMLDNTKIVLEEGTLGITSSAFQNCSSLTSIIIPNSVRIIGIGAFSGCNGLTSITIPSSLTSIEYGVFLACKSLRSVAIPNSVTSIGDNAFNGCISLASVIVPNNVTSIGYATFSGCSLLSSVTISNSVMSIGGYAFSGCSNLTSITISNRVKSIGIGAFDGCSGLTSVNISDLASWCNISFSDNLSNPLYYAHILYLNGKEVKDLVIPSVVTSIESRTFSNCSCLTSIRIPNSVTSIESGAFQGCDNLLTVNSEITEPFNCKNSFSENTLRKGTLYVPEGTKELYTRFDGWREFLKIEEMGEHTEKYVWLSMRDGQGITRIKVKKGETQELTIMPEEGWKLLMVTMNGQDVTAQLKDGGTLTTPAIMQDATIAVVYEQEVPSEVAAVRQSKATVKVVDDGVVISNAEADTRCTVYASNGQQVVNAIIDGGSRKIMLQKGQVYVLTLGTRTLKFAL